MGIGTLRRYHEVRRPAGYRPAGDSEHAEHQLPSQAEHQLPHLEEPAEAPAPTEAPAPPESPEAPAEAPASEVKPKATKRPKAADPVEGQ